MQAHVTLLLLPKTETPNFACSSLAARSSHSLPSGSPVETWLKQHAGIFRAWQWLCLGLEAQGNLKHCQTKEPTITLFGPLDRVAPEPLGNQTRFRSTQPKTRRCLPPFCAASWLLASDKQAAFVLAEALMRSCLADAVLQVLGQQQALPQKLHTANCDKSRGNIPNTSVITNVLLWPATSNEWLVVQIVLHLHFIQGCP